MSIFCPCPKALQETYIKRRGLINLAEEILRQPNIHAVVWLLMSDFSQIYSKNWRVWESALCVSHHQTRKSQSGFFASFRD